MIKSDKIMPGVEKMDRKDFKLYPQNPRTWGQSMKLTGSRFRVGRKYVCTENTIGYWQ